MINIDAHSPVLIAGPTASGKSALALHIARTQGGIIVNADALQVFGGWRIITARPDDHDLSLAPHALYGHVPYDAPYSTGQWLREVTPYITGTERPIVVGGTGLNFLALTSGLADIPPTDPALRARGNTLSLSDLLDALDPDTTARIDTQNRMRVQRAWEVLHQTGRTMADWQDATPPPVLPITRCTRISLDVPTDWLNTRITQRFDIMLDQGALTEAAAMLPAWDPSHQSSKAIGASDLIAHLNGEISLKNARANAIIQSKQYAKRQRTWFRSKHKDWTQLDLSKTTPENAIHFTS